METYRKIIKLLKEHCPPKYPISVRRVELKGYDGLCKKKDGKFSIKINRDLDEKAAIDVLIHEWSHAICWTDQHDAMSTEEFNRTMHGDHWGIAYAKVYRIFEEHYLNTL
jgi:Zn-dependent peptidase ImmA (M78 family)